MSARSDAPATGLLTQIPTAALWGLLIALSVVLAAILEMAGIPAARLLGPMIAGILLGVNGGAVRVPRLPYLGAQGSSAA